MKFWGPPPPSPGPPLRRKWNDHDRCVPQKQYEIVVEQLMRAVSMQTPMLVVPDKLYGQMLTSVNKETNLNVRENAGAMLGQVQSHLVDIEGQLKTTRDQLAQAKKELAQEKGLRQDGSRALYIYRSGRIENKAPMAAPNGVAQRVSFDELKPAELVPIREYRDIDYFYPRSRRYDFRLLRTIGSLHVYEEVS